MQIDTDWNGPPPPIERDINVRHRAACDLNPLDIGDPAQLLQLNPTSGPISPNASRASTAPSRSRAKPASTSNAPTPPNGSRKSSRSAPTDAATIVYHSIFLQYPPREARAAIIDAIQSAGARATANAPLAWVRLEPEALTDNVRDSPRMVIDITTWPGGQRRILGYTDGHVRAVYAS